MLDPAAAVLGSHATGKQAALANLCSGLATVGAQRSALGSSELHLVVAQVIFSEAFFAAFCFQCHAVLSPLLLQLLDSGSSPHKRLH